MVCSKCGNTGHKSKTCGQQTIYQFLGIEPPPQQPLPVAIPLPPTPVIELPKEGDSGGKPCPSEEQLQILEMVKKGHNVVGDCVAGAGKTTSVLMLAHALPEKQILQITYNSQLKAEVRTKVQSEHLTNIEIHTYHSLVVRYYDNHGYDDVHIRKVVTGNARPKASLPRADILVIDEAQDMTFLYYRLIRKFLGDLTTAPQLVVLGDKYQGIYKFKDADPRYLLLSHAIWQKSFVPVSLSTSYRVTNPIAAYVNEVMLGHERIKAAKAGPPVQHYRCNLFAANKIVGPVLLSLLREGSVAPEDIFILAPSISNSRQPVRLLENVLVENGIGCYFPSSDEQKLGEEVMAGKVVFSTFHQAKGRERKVVVVYGFDKSYFSFYAKDANPDECPETLYVAVTRAKSLLILLENEQCGPLPFLKPVAPAAPFVNLWGTEGVVVKTRETKGGGKYHRTSVTELTKFLNEHSISLLTTIMNEVFTEEVPETYSVDIPSKVEGAATGTCEEVSDINGIVIPAMYEARLCQSSTVEIDVRNKYIDLCNDGTHEFIRKACEKLPKKPVTVAEYVYMTLIYVSIVEKVYNKIEQIQRYDWLTESMVSQCFACLESHNVNADTIFEEEVSHVSHKYVAEYGTVEVAGRLDAVTEDTVWEFKCVSALTMEHKLQLLIYAWIWKEGDFEKKDGKKKFKIANLRTGQILRLNERSHLIQEAVAIAFGNKYKTFTDLTDEEFIDRCLAGVQPVKAVKATACMIDD
jgi:hypothetical protein